MNFSNILAYVIIKTGDQEEMIVMRVVFVLMPWQATVMVMVMMMMMLLLMVMLIVSGKRR